MERVHDVVLFLISMELLWVFSLHLIWWKLWASCKLSLLCLSMFLISLMFLVLLSWIGVRFCQMLFWHLIDTHMFFSFFQLIYCGLHILISYIEISLHLWNEEHLIMMDDFLCVVVFNFQVFLLPHLWRKLFVILLLCSVFK